MLMQSLRLSMDLFETIATVVAILCAAFVIYLVVQWWWQQRTAKVNLPGHVEVRMGHGGKWHFTLRGEDGHDLAISTGPGWASKAEAEHQASRMWW